MIELKNISKTYYLDQVEVPALKRVNLTIEDNEFLAIVGPSGSGKSTLMNIIGCLDVANEGEYLLDGQDINEKSENQLSDIRKEKIGFIFQQFNLLNELTAYENVEMPLLYHKISASERRKRVEDALKSVGLEDRMDHRPTQLSGGQQQRVAIARVLACKPSVILADEPTGNLDSSSGKEIMDIIENLWKDGKTVILITHDTVIAKRAKKQVYVKDGIVSLKVEA